MRIPKLNFPFTAIVGQEEMKLALVLNASNPKLSGVLIRGEKGTTKSLSVRSLVTLLPNIKAVKNCPFNCDPDDLHKMCTKCREKRSRNAEMEIEERQTHLINLPINSTEDRVVGTLDLELAVKKGEKHFEPGVLADASIEKGGDRSVSQVMLGQESQQIGDYTKKLEPGDASHMLRSDGRVNDKNYKGRLVREAEMFRVPPLHLEKDRCLRKKSGRHMPTRTSRKRGRYVRSTSERCNGDIAFDATIRAAAPYQIYRLKHDVAIAIEEPDIREKVREMKAGCLILFVVDASGSMGTELITETKAAMISLLLDAYQRRDKVALVAFKGDSAQVLLPPTNSIELAKKLLQNLQVGGTTPLGHGLLKAHELLMNHIRRGSYTTPVMVLITDGVSNVGVKSHRSYEGLGYSMLSEELFEIARMIGEDKRIKTLVIDTEEKRFSVFRKTSISPPMALRIAMTMGSAYFKVEDFRAEGSIILAVKQQVY